MEYQIENLVKLIKENSLKNCSSVNIFINSEGHKVEYTTREPQSLKKDKITMKNINGNWIEE